MTGMTIFRVSFNVLSLESSLIIAPFLWRVKKGKIPFHFENMWLLSDGLKELVREWWTGYLVAGTNSHCLAEKLKSLKKDLKRWNKEVFGNVFIRKSEVLSRIQLWDSKERVNPLSFEEAEARMRDLEEYKNCVLMEETSWRQKSRETWLKEGDKNTGFFHKMANARAKRKFLSKVKINGVTLIDEEDIKSGCVGLIGLCYWKMRIGDCELGIYSFMFWGQKGLEV